MIQHMGVNHGGADILMTQEFLDRSAILPPFQQVGRKGVAEGMAAGRFRNARLGHRPSLYRLLVQTPSMARVSVTHLRQNLPTYLKRVQAGEAIQVTSHGRVIARIEPEQDPAEEARLWLEGLGGSVRLGDVVASIADGDADLEGSGDADHL